MGNYETLPGFEYVYLEDSWVLGICLEPGRAMIDMEFVLTEGHPSYSAPLLGEQYCYRRGEIRFDGVTSVNWVGQSVVKPAEDAAGERDFGSIDDFSIAGGSFTLEGDFGRLRIDSLEPIIDLR